MGLGGDEEAARGDRLTGQVGYLLDHAAAAGAAERQVISRPTEAAALKAAKPPSFSRTG